MRLIIPNIGTVFIKYNADVGEYGHRWLVFGVVVDSL
jgi:hypothetical protein